jgi:hypothetical protein
MNYYTESFDQFASRLSGTDLALYAGAGIILWILFKDKMSPVQKTIMGLLEKIKSNTPLKPVTPVAVVVPSVKPVVTTKEDIFFKLIVSWKQTRDLAAECGCEQAVKVADDMFPFLSPVVCVATTLNKEENVK